MVQILVNGLILGGLYTMGALGLSMVLSVLDVPDFSHAQVYALGAFASYFGVVLFGIPLLLGVVLGVAVGAALSVTIEVAVYRPVRRAAHITSAIVAFAVLVALQSASVTAFGGHSRSVPLGVRGETLRLGSTVIPTLGLIVFGVAMACVGALWFVTNRTPLGLMMRAMSEDEFGAECLGVDSRRVRLATAGIAGGLAGLSGVLLGLVFHVSVGMGFFPLLKGFMIVIVAGVGSIPATLAVGLALGIAEGLSSSYLSPSAGNLIVLAGLVVFLAVRPTGLSRVGSVGVRI